MASLKSVDAALLHLQIQGRLEIYEKLWTEAVAAFERGEPKMSLHLPDKTGDSRRGVTLVFRLPATVRDPVMDYIGRLGTLYPAQYFYRPEELHVTALSIFTMTGLWEREMARFAECRHIIGEVLERQRRFGIEFRGVTASPDCVLIQGFPLDDGLATIRSELRDAFAGAGYGDMLDRRYKVTAAHITVMRFCRPGLDTNQLLAFLKASRDMNFGMCTIEKLQLIFGDWFASADKVKILEEYPLK